MNIAVCVLALSFCFISGAMAQGAGKGQSSSQELERRVQVLEFQVKSVMDRVAYRSATLDCNSSKYDEFLFGSGSLAFFAACTKVEPYLEGHRISVSVGNPHAFNFSNVKGSLSYGKSLYDSIGKKVEVSLTEPIRGASWNSITIVVNPSKPEDMRYLSLSLDAGTAGSSR